MEDVFDLSGYPIRNRSTEKIYAIEEEQTQTT
jgi:hypothetical protein